MKYSNLKLKHVGRIGSGLGILALSALLSMQSLQTAGADEAKHNFVGAGKCKTCHKTEKQGEQMRIWEESKHAEAFKLLGTPEAKAAAAKLGIDDPQKSGKCLKCHSTAYYFTESLVSNIDTDKSGAPELTVEESVSCESCHGPGSDYKKKSVMEDHAASVAAGMTAKPEESCVKCHNDSSPTWKNDRYTLADGTKVGFDFKQAYEKIKHPVPEK